MLHAAADITFFRKQKPDGSFADVTWWMKNEDLPVPITDDTSGEWDAVIVDDMNNWKIIRDAGIRYRHMIWYIHGTYHKWPGFQDAANLHLKNVHILYPDTERQRYIRGWYKNKPLSEATIPIHLQDHYYVPVSKSRNGKCYAMGNEIMATSRIYGPQEEVEDIFARVKPDLFGFNAKPPANVNFRGSASPIREHVREYSACIAPSRVGTLGFVWLETMAAGVPLITTPKVDLPEDLSGKAYVIVRSPEEFDHWATRLKEDQGLSLEMGHNGQQFLAQYYPFRSYRTRLNTWLETILN